MKGHKVTIKDIANKTQLSISTISRVLSGKGEQYRISNTSQQKIRDAVKELNYIPNYFAANLKSGKSKTIAMIVPSLTNPFFANIASEINAEVRKYGYTTLIADSDANYEIEKLELQQMVSRNIEGLIIVPCGDHLGHIQSLHSGGLPIICIDRYFEDQDIPYVATDNYEGALLATEFLIENGHTLISCIQGSPPSTPNRLRVKGFTDAMEAAGIKNYNIVGDDFSIQNGYLETRLLLQQKNSNRHFHTEQYHCTWLPQSIKGKKYSNS
ncbi:MAG: LacI family DNA-binding transcriptional regulator [Saprospiraceae bacterium]|nr:LacI family DNA-binding transcriptional regulator [Saprospiraceae bacterium]